MISFISSGVSRQPPSSHFFTMAFKPALKMCIRDSPYTDVLTEAQYRQAFGRVEHPFTGVDYIEYYKELIQGEGAEVEIILGNNAQDILPYAKDVLACDIHTRARSKRLLLQNGARTALGLSLIHI